MRSTAQIQENLQQQWMNNNRLAEFYGFTIGSSFTDFYSKVSIEGLIIYIVAYCTHTLEYLFSLHLTEIETAITNTTPGRVNWYATKAKQFLLDEQLIENSDTYDTSNLTEQQIAEKQIVKHAVAIVNDTTHSLVIKVAGEDADGNRTTLEAYNQQILAYLNAIKYAGVVLSLITAQGDNFKCTIDVYYNPLLNPENVRESCIAAVKNYISNLPYNGEYRNMTLIDNLQTVDGVEYLEFISAEYKPVTSNDFLPITAAVKPYAGYFITTDQDIILNMKIYTE